MSSLFLCNLLYLRVQSLAWTHITNSLFSGDTLCLLPT